MRNVQLDWHQGAALTGVLVLARAAVAVAAHTNGRAAPAVAVRTKGRAARGATRFGPYLGESAIIAALYSVWQLAAAQAQLNGTSSAFARGRSILRFEHRVGLPSERDPQRLIDGHRSVEQLCNLYYAGVHFFALGVLLVWLFARHRERYTRVRTVVVILTLSCLLIQFWAVAPPRLLPDQGFTDTAAKLGQSVYQVTGVTTDQLSAMPSLHVGWAVLVAWAVVTVSSSRWRWLVLAHPLVTTFVVVATANHFWLDGIVAIGLLVIAIVITDAGARLLAGRRYLLHRRVELREGTADAAEPVRI